MMKKKKRSDDYDDGEFATKICPVIKNINLLSLLLKSGPRLVDLQHKQMKKGRSCKIGIFWLFSFSSLCKSNHAHSQTKTLIFCKNTKTKVIHLKFWKAKLKTLTIILSE